MKYVFISILSSLFLLFSCQENEYSVSCSKMKQVQPWEGCAIGAYLGCGAYFDSSCVEPAEFNLMMEKQHAIFSRYIDMTYDSSFLAYDIKLWFAKLKAVNAAPLIFLEPKDKLNSIANGEFDKEIKLFAQICSGFDGKVLVSFGHEMNISEYAWGNKPQEYINAFRRIDQKIDCITDNVYMVWVPSEVYSQKVDPAPYWPGDKYVDFVGLTVFDRDYDNNNEVGPYHFKTSVNWNNFYQIYSVEKNKPLIIAETAIFDINIQYTGPYILSKEKEIENKNNWIRQIYNPKDLKDNFPNLNAIVYFHVKKVENKFETNDDTYYDILIDWRIPTEPPDSNVYKILIQDSYFKSYIP